MSSPTPRFDGWMSEAELSWLAHVGAQVRSAAEVGCWKGRSTAVLLDAVHGPVYAVDHWMGSAAERDSAHWEAVSGGVFEQFMRNVGHRENLMVRRGASTSIAHTLPKIDFVFIDAGHTYEEVAADIAAWRPKTLRLLAGHDYHMPDVRRAVDEAFGSSVQTAAESIWYVIDPCPVRLMIASPFYDATCTTGFMRSYMNTEAFLKNNGIRCELAFLEKDSLIPRARIALVASFLKSDCTHLMMIDSDIRWSPSSVLDLIRWDKLVNSGIYPKKTIPTAFPVNFLEGSQDKLPLDRETGCFQIKDAPTGFLMLKREALERMIEAYPDRRCMIAEGGWTAAGNHLTYDLFPCGADETGMYLSEDFGFCRLWRQVGGEIWMDPHIELGHTGKHEFVGRIADFITPTPANNERSLHGCL